MLRALTGCAGCIMLGAFAGVRLIRRKNVLSAWQRAFETMRVHCVCGRNTPQEILMAGAAHVQALCEIARLGAIGDQWAAWGQVPAEAVALLLEGIRAVLDGGQQEQEMRLSYVMARLDEMRLRTQEKCDRDARLYMMLGVWSGLCALLIF